MSERADLRYERVHFGDKATFDDRRIAPKSRII